MKQNTFKKIKSNRRVMWGLWAGIILLILLYFKFFFTSGIYFDDYFLKRTTQSQQTTYFTETYEGPLLIEVTPLSNQTVRVHFDLVNKFKTTYLVHLIQKNMGDEWRLTISNDEGRLLFNGYYQLHSPFLWDENGEAYFEGNISLNSIRYDENYQILLGEVASLATFSGVTIKGNPTLLIMGVILFILSFIEMKFPLFFFKLQIGVLSEDATPSDFYLDFQKISWKIGFAVSLVFCLLALTTIEIL